MLVSHRQGCHCSRQTRAVDCPEWRSRAERAKIDATMTERAETADAEGFIWPRFT